MKSLSAEQDSSYRTLRWIIEKQLEKKNVKRRFAICHRASRYPEFGVIIGVLVVFLTFSFIGRRFLSLDNFTRILTVVSELGIITIGVAFVMICGEFDLSVGATYCFCAFVFATLVKTGLYSPLALVAALGVGIFIGFVNGTIVVRTGIPSFIATLGMMMGLKGLLLAITKGSSVRYVGDAVVPIMLSRFVGYGFRPSHFWFIGLTLLFTYILVRTRYGNWVFATGGDKNIARAMGVNVNRVKVTNFCISGLLAGLSGSMVLVRFQIANPAFGTGIEFEAITAAVIGGTSLMGGYGTVIGAALGAFLVSMIRSGLILAGAPGYWYQGFVGVILVVASIITLRLTRRE